MLLNLQFLNFCLDFYKNFKKEINKDNIIIAIDNVISTGFM